LWPRCFGLAIRDEPFPYKGFCITKHIKPYNGEVRPHTWLQDYNMAVNIAKGNTLIAYKFLPIMLKGTTRVWLDSLSRNTINSWGEMKAAFNHNFEGTYKRSYTAGDLACCRQKDNESSRDYLARWITIKNACENMHDIQAIDYFTEGLVRGTGLRHKLKRKKPQTLAEMITIASNYATADDDARGAPLLQQKSKAGGKRKSNNDDEAEIAYTGLPIMTPIVNKGRGKGGNRSGGRGKRKATSNNNRASSS
jgi:hypothetical protein